MFELSSRIKTFEKILIFIQQYWLPSQVQLKHSEFGTFLIEKVEIENDTTNIVFPKNQDLSQINISSETSLKGHKYEAMLIKGTFLKFIYHDHALASGIVYFQFSEMLNYNVNLDLELNIEGKRSEENTFCMTLNSVSDHDYEWDSESCELVEVSDDKLQCSCQDGKRLQNFGGLVSSVQFSSTSTSTTPTTTIRTTTSVFSSISSTSTPTNSSSSTSPAPCEVGKNDMVFTVVYALLSISLIFSAAIFFAVLFATRYM